MPDALIKKAASILADAAKKDQKELYNDASVKYISGAQLLLDACRKMPDGDSRKDVIRQKAMEYISRTEDIQKLIKTKVVLEQRKIAADSVGHSYEEVFHKCLDAKLRMVSVHDAYIQAHHQMLNFVRFCEMLVKHAPNLRIISLRTAVAARQNENGFRELEASLSKRNVDLSISYSDTIHDREIKFDNGWIVKIGRGLDYFKNAGKYAIGACDQSLRPCHETVIDIFKIK